jgi:arsenate reductase (thioredoxin)
MTAHWGVDDPANVVGSMEEQRQAFNRAFRDIDARIKLFVSLPFDSLDRMALQEKIATKQLP